MKSLKSLAIINIIVLLCLFAFAGQAAATAPETGEEALFTNSTQPDALIVLDLSGSMEWNPAGGNDVYGNSSCSGTFYSSSGSGHTTNCSRLNIAKRSIFDLLDDNDDNTVNSADETSLEVRIGYMRFYDCSSDDTSNSYTSGCIQIPGSSSTSRRYIGSKYSQIYCNSNTSCTVSSTGSYSVGGASATGGTPLASALRKAKIYLDAHKLADSAKDCRKKFVILITDGSDTFACSGNGTECDGGRYKGRRDAVAWTKTLADAGYKVFVVGFGASMPDYLENTLNWMAYYGGTDNPNQANSGSTSGFTPGTAGACTTATDSATATCYDSSGSHSTANFKANTNDPGYATLSGYAFLAADADQLAAALKAAMNIIRQANYSFSQSSVQSSRTSDENHLYEGSFEPVDTDSFWKGHLKKYAINDDGTVGSMVWDAGALSQTNESNVANYARRNIRTYRGGSLINFTKCVYLTSNCSSYPYCDDNPLVCVENISADNLNIDPTLTSTVRSDMRNNIVGYIRGNPTYNPEQNVSAQVWKLGDVFRSTPITVGTPSAFYYDARDANAEFNDHRTNHERSSTNGYRVIVAGANDGQMHAYKTSNGSEAWSFIPPNLLSKLKNMTHTSHPTSLTHQYFVDGPVTVADVWCVSPNTNCGSADGTDKTDYSWATIMVFGLGRGATNQSWSSSAYCDSGINATYSTSYPYYCGYHALRLSKSSASDTVTSLNPTYLWRISPNSSQAPYLGDSWSKMMVGRVKIHNTSGALLEKWVGFIGAGYNAGDCSGGGTCDPRGKGFYVVDLYDGTILWSFTYSSSTTSSTTSTAMKYSLPAQASIVDTDNDGFVDLAYIGDMGGKMWRMKFCLSSDTACGVSAGGVLTKTWSGNMFFDSPSGNIRPIYTSPAVAKDNSGNLWVYWGTGDKTDPTASNAQEHFYGVKDNDRTSTWTGSNIDNIVSENQTYDISSTSNVGWRIQLAGGGEKILADPTVFGGVVYFTTYTPSAGSDPCEQGGTANLYGVNYTTGGGVIPQADGTTGRSKGIGSGIPSAPVISMKPSGGSNTPDLYVTTSGGGGTSASTQRVDMDPPGVSNRTNMLYWRDRRLQ